MEQTGNIFFYIVTGSNSVANLKAMFEKNVS